MSFLGNKEGWASPRLKDAEIPSGDTEALYVELTITIRMLYHLCKLVHADLSEYNVLYHNSHLYIIDVSQSVEHDHPSAFDFLRLDIKNVDEFWARRGVQTLGLRRTFDFVVADKILPSDEEENDERLSEYIKDQMQRQEQSVPSDIHPAVESSGQQLSDDSPKQVKISEPSSASNDLPPVPPKEDEAHEDAVFMRSYIPRTLNEVYDPERDVGKLRRGEGDQLIYGAITGVVSVNQQPSGPDSDDAVSEDEDESEEGEEEEVKWTPRVPRGHHHEEREAKKERQKVVKEEAREKRKQKIPKAEKKRKIKQTKGRK